MELGVAAPCPRQQRHRHIELAQYLNGSGQPSQDEPQNAGIDSHGFARSAVCPRPLGYNAYKHLDLVGVA